jgi:hypothetical protein
MSVTVRPWRLGGGHHRPAAERVAVARAEQGTRLVEDRGHAMGRGPRAARAATWPPRTEEGGAHPRTVRTQVPRRSCACEPSETERHRVTVRLATALREHRHLRSDRVLCLTDGSPLSADIVKHHVERAARRAHIGQNGVHQLRHTFCSHLAMRGAPARAIQELAGHQDLTTTQRYMHLSPAAIEGAIRLLEMEGPPKGGRHVLSVGDIPETAEGESAISNP